MKKTDYKRDDLKKQSKSNTLEYYLTKNLPKEALWNKKENSKTHFENEAKKEFLKKNLKPTKVLPKDMKKSKDVPDNLGYFESRFGTISVGYKKYKKNTDIAFSLIPEKVRKQESIPKRKQESPNTYFGGEMKRDKKYFKASKLTFKYNPDTEEIEKLENDNDGIVDKEEKLLYEDKHDEERIKYLESLRSQSDITGKYEINEEIDDLREIQDEKEEDNTELLKEIRNFVRKMKRSLIRKIIESDEAIMRSKRIITLSSDIAFLKRLLKKLLKEQGKEIDIDNLSEEELKEILKVLKNKID